MKAYGEVASSADNPSAASNVWTMLPAVMPSAAATPGGAAARQAASQDEERVLPGSENEDDGRRDEQPVVMNAQHGRHFIRPDGHIGKRRPLLTKKGRVRHETKAAGTGSSPRAWRSTAQCMASSPRMLAAAFESSRSLNSGTAAR